ncbi:MAG: hypothetical protein R3F60_29670 [bacterium]
MNTRRAWPGALLACLAMPTGAFALDWDAITLNGYTSFEFETQLTDDGNGDPNHSFDADLFDLVFNFQVSPRARAAADVTWEHGSASEDGRGNVALEYGLVEYSFSDLVRLQAGKLFVPFGVFNEIHTAKPVFLTVKEAAATNKPSRIVDNARRFFPRWAVGLNLRGDAPIGDSSFDYDLMISNGEQEETNPFEEDNNEGKSVTGRMRFYLADRARMGLSFHYDAPKFDGVERSTAVGAEANIRIGDAEILLELVYGEFKLTQASPDDPDKQRQLGTVAQLSYLLPTGTTPYFQFQTIDPDVDADGDDGVLLVTGVNQEVDAFILKLEHNYATGGDKSSLAAFADSRFHEIKAAVVLGF